jgi:hypothetical protein
MGDNLEGSGPNVIGALPWHFSGGIEENHKNTNEGSGFLS